MSLFGRVLDVIGGLHDRHIQILRSDQRDDQRSIHEKKEGGEGKRGIFIFRVPWNRCWCWRGRRWWCLWARPRPSANSAASPCALSSATSPPITTRSLSSSFLSLSLSLLPTALVMQMPFVLWTRISHSPLFVWVSPRVSPSFPSRFPLCLWAVSTMMTMTVNYYSFVPSSFSHSRTYGSKYFLIRCTYNLYA